VLLSLALGTPALSVIGVLGAALTLGIRRGGVLVSLLITPLYIPTLIFATGAVHAASYGLFSEQFLGNIAGLAAILLFLFPLTLWSAAHALRGAVE